MKIKERIENSKKDTDVFKKHLSASVRSVFKNEESGNAFLRCYFSDSIIEKRFPGLASRKSELPLFGSLFAVKDNYCVSDFPISLGLNPPFMGQAKAHAEIIQNLIDKGATLLGNTNMDPLALDSTGKNPAYGDTVNLSFPDLLSGGSSSGSAVAVSNQTVDFALGSDFGGSIRIPAACNGIAGLKFSPAALPRKGIVLFDKDYDCPGLLTENIRDMHFLLEYFCKQSNDEVTTLIIPQGLFPETKDSDLIDSFDSIVNRLGKDYTIIKEEKIDLQEINKARKILCTFSFHDFAEKFGLQFRELPDSANALLKYHQTLSTQDRKEALSIQEKYLELMNRYQTEKSLILSPTLPFLPRKNRMTANSKIPLNYFLCLANLAGAAALSFPLGCLRGNFPMSLHLTGWPGSESLLLNTASNILKLQEDNYQQL